MHPWSPLRYRPGESSASNGNKPINLVVLLDVMMPEDFQDIHIAMKSIENGNPKTFGSVNYFLYSAKSDEELSKYVKELGFKGYFRKPVSGKRLKEIINNSF